MSDDGNRHDHLPTEGEPNFSENGSETMENDQPGLPSWAAALTAQVTAQLQATFEAQLTQMSEEQAGRDAANRAELRTALEECSASARDARIASAQLQDQRQEIEALSPLTAHRYYALQAPLVNR
jgi:transketolase